ncbi:hypothetical protein [Sphingobium sp.]|uniref:hypothetical protein n=1 Tax=Sphingobium sp. TaxID=1912891 RepID=UPI002BA94DEC|nr:hypothetical protein [Sphingobium sp.]HUD95322.1 hypothetical protein [Sphingobium sp.]
MIGDMLQRFGRLDRAGKDRPHHRQLVADTMMEFPHHEGFPLEAFVQCALVCVPLVEGALQLRSRIAVELRFRHTASPTVSAQERISRDPVPSLTTYRKFADAYKFYWREQR